jgi:hypothetical protein
MAAGLVAFVVPSATAASFTMTSSPALNQKFNKSWQDYTVACPAGSVRLTLSSPAGTAPKVNGKAVKLGTTATNAPMTPGRRAIVSATIAGKRTVYSVRCLPADFPKFTATGSLTSASPFVAMSVVTSLIGPVVPYAFVIDSHGVPIWWKNTPGVSTMDVKPLSGGEIGFWSGLLFSERANGPFTIYNLNGTKVRDVVPNVGTSDPHESHPTSRGTIYRVAYVTRENADLSALRGPSDHAVLDGVIQEIDSAGNVVWQWDSKDHIGVAETPGLWFGILSAVSGKDPIDMVHLNAVEEDKEGNLLLSFRHANAIYKIRKSDGSVIWKLGGTVSGNSLTVVGDSQYPTQPLAGQHDVRSLPNGDVTVHDNGTGVTGRGPRVTSWRINESARTATLVESFSNPGLTSSGGIGSARKLSDGGWLVAWGASSQIRGYDAAHRQIFGINLAGGGKAYRAAPITSSEFSRTQFVAGMDAQYPG